VCVWCRKLSRVGRRIVSAIFGYGVTFTNLIEVAILKDTYDEKKIRCDFDLSDYIYEAEMNNFYTSFARLFRQHLEE
jgi:hypothetical protein